MGRPCPGTLADPSRVHGDSPGRGIRPVPRHIRAGNPCRGTPAGFCDVSGCGRGRGTLADSCRACHGGRPASQRRAVRGSRRSRAGAKGPCHRSPWACRGGRARRHGADPPDVTSATASTTVGVRKRERPVGIDAGADVVARSRLETAGDGRSGPAAEVHAGDGAVPTATTNAHQPAREDPTP